MKGWQPSPTREPGALYWTGPCSTRTVSVADSVADLLNLCQGQLDDEGAQVLVEMLERHSSRDVRMTATTAC